MELLALEGIDNVGKTSVSRLLAKSLGAEGAKVMIAAPHRDAEPSSGPGLYELFVAGGCHAARANRLVIDAVQNATDCAEAHNLDYLLFDRHWMTAFTMTRDPVLRAGWTRTKTALLVPGNRPLAEMAEDEPWSTVEALQDFKQRYEGLADDYHSDLLGVYVVEQPERDISAVAQTILWDERIQR